jgi:gamma-glutamyltranspeptidase/glutathione hydrolase
MNLDRIEGKFSPTEDGKCSISQKGMVSTAFPEATQAGVDILKEGGNAIDAACASAFALGVCEPQASGLGGQSMVIFHTQDKVICLDGSSRVPSLTHIDSINSGEMLTGYRAATVPSTPAVLGYLHFRYGNLPWKKILEPAIRIARNGYKITALQNKLQKREIESFNKVSSLSGAKYFLKEDKIAYAIGDLFIQHDLSNCLEHMANNDARSFYTGEIGKAIDQDMKENGGFLRYDDLAMIPWPVERKSIRRKYRRLNVYTMPPPAAGRTLLLTLLMLRHLPSKLLRNPTPQIFHFLAETFRKALLNRRERPFDPNIYPQLPHDKVLLSRDFSQNLALSIQDTIDPSLPMVDPYPSENDTTHLSVMDKDGNMVGITQSIERVYGSKAAAKGLGFLYNNYMSALETKDPTHPYYLRPNSAPWSSVAPIIGFLDKKPWLVAGSPGSERIFSCMAQFISNMIDRNLPISEAMIAPRIHCSTGGTLSYESDRFNPEIISYLENSGYKMSPKEPYSFYLGAVHAIIKSQKTGDFQGVAEIRRDGIAAGP